MLVPYRDFILQNREKAGSAIFLWFNFREYIARLMLRPFFSRFLFLQMRTKVVKCAKIKNFTVYHESVCWCINSPSLPVPTAEGLAESAVHFRHSSRRLQRKQWWQQCRVRDLWASVPYTCTYKISLNLIKHTRQSFCVPLFRNSGGQVYFN